MITLEPTWDEINDLPTPLTVGERSFVERIERLYKDDDSRHLEVFAQAIRYKKTFFLYIVTSWLPVS